MPVWLLNILVGIIKPIVEGIIEKLLISVRLNALEKDQAALKEGFGKLASATDTKEIQDAARDIANRWNNRS